MTESHDWTAVGKAVKARRIERGYPSVQKAVDAAPAGVALESWRQIERGEVKGKRRDATLAAIEKTLGWEQGSLLAIATGGKPTDVGPSVDVVTRVDRLEAEVDRLRRSIDGLTELLMARTRTTAPPDRKSGR